MNCSVNNLSKTVICVLIFILKHSGVLGIWPPPYQVNLSQEETFIISELLDKSDVQDVYDEEEMIKKEEMEQMKIEAQNEKYYRIHQQLLNNRNQRETKYNRVEKKTIVMEEFNPDKEELVPWKAGFVDDDEKFIPEKETIYFDEKSYKGNEKEKREESEKETTENYDYANFKSEYNKEISAADKSNDTLKYTTIKEDESVKDSVKTLVDFKQTPRNCTEEETKGIGMGAVECFWMEAKKPRTNNKVLENILRVFIIWIVVYAVVAIPCWCQYGWCCCCCRCKFCNPQEQIDEVKKFTANNPVGVFHDAEGNKITYKATTYEKYAQKKLDKEIQRL